MTNEEFKTLARDVLLALTGASITLPSSRDCAEIASSAVEIAAQFERALTEHRQRLSITTTSLTELETAELRKGHFIGTIRLLRERTGMTLLDAKQLVDKVLAELEAGQ